MKPRKRRPSPKCPRCKRAVAESPPGLLVCPCGMVKATRPQAAFSIIVR